MSSTSSKNKTKSSNKKLTWVLIFFGYLAAITLGFLERSSLAGIVFGTAMIATAKQFDGKHK